MPCPKDCWGASQLRVRETYCFLNGTSWRTTGASLASGRKKNGCGGRPVCRDPYDSLLLQMCSTHQGDQRITTHLISGLATAAGWTDKGLPQHLCARSGPRQRTSPTPLCCSWAAQQIGNSDQKQEGSLLPLSEEGNGHIWAESTLTRDCR